MAKVLKPSNVELDFVTDLTEATVGDDLLVRNVVILGPTSVNAKGEVYRRYTDNAMQKAVPLFEGIAAYADHPDATKKAQPRSIKDMYGYYKNVRFELQEHKVRGDLQIYPNPLGQHIASIIKTNPRVVGNSINAGGIVRMENGIQLVEQIFPRTPNGIKASVDLVGDPATTRSLVEGVNSNHSHKESQMGLENLTITELREARPDVITQLLAEGKASSDAEVTKLTGQLGTLTAQVTALTEEKTNLVKDLDLLKAKDSLNAQRAKVDTLLTESKLPSAGITDVFKNTLYALTEQKQGDKVITVEEQVKALIEDRKVALGLKGVHGNGGGKTPLLEGKQPVGSSTGATKLAAADVVTALVEATQGATE